MPRLRASACPPFFELLSLSLASLDPRCQSLCRGGSSPSHIPSVKELCKDYRQEIRCARGWLPLTASNNVTFASNHGSNRSDVSVPAAHCL
ncbi:hypothetical protein BDP81DRAFT_416719 [Colletotrichum phormii]|uniref:Uncharacterized protein n=1 Tax=Colletotrichum phormii TaxID=359342 RepID=A0AAJ0A2R3_9PEZI|nr:uncharacterized protein BDP81DRAFT_416719 [Colletotrichum phormii]KAK1654878.1 hypothetical protein BDP81DRAFT_416719 [Colletotrichum phormii]